jgi:hypothetical protein
MVIIQIIGEEASRSAGVKPAKSAGEIGPSMELRA